MEDEAHDWDLLLPISDPQIHLPPPPPSAPLDISKDFVEIGVSEGIIRSDYFSSDGVGGEIEAELGSSVSSDNPSWIEPCHESAARKHHSSEFWSDSSSSEGHRFANRELGFEEVREIGAFWSDSSGEEEEEEEEKIVDTVEEEEKSDAVVVAEEKKGMVWWKLPLEVLKFCLFKVNPGWSIAVAAAVMGIVILKTRLYRMKKKSRGVSLKLTVEDKTVSQFTKNAARLNEAFSVVRRVPMVRPLLPSAGVTQWPVLNMR